MPQRKFYSTKKKSKKIVKRISSHELNDNAVQLSGIMTTAPTNI